MASYVGQIKSAGTTYPVASTLYGTCSTAAGTAAKVVTCSNFDTLTTGVTIHVKFTYSNSVASPTLNVNSTGAKTIYRYGTTAPSTSAKTSWNAGSVVSFTYDGTYWQMNGWINDDTTYSVATTSANGLMSSSDKTVLSAPSDSSNGITDVILKRAYQPWGTTLKIKLAAAGHALVLHNHTTAYLLWMAGNDGAVSVSNSRIIGSTTLTFTLSNQNVANNTLTITAPSTGSITCIYTRGNITS